MTRPRTSTRLSFQGNQECDKFSEMGGLPVGTASHMQCRTRCALKLPHVLTAPRTIEWGWISSYSVLSNLWNPSWNNLRLYRPVRAFLLMLVCQLAPVIRGQGGQQLNCFSLFCTRIKVSLPWGYLIAQCLDSSLQIGNIVRVTDFNRKKVPCERDRVAESLRYGGSRLRGYDGKEGVALAQVYRQDNGIASAADGLEMHTVL